jgi:hypothetical protein
MPEDHSRSYPSIPKVVHATGREQISSLASNDVTDFAGDILVTYEAVPHALVTADEDASIDETPTENGYIHTYRTSVVGDLKMSREAVLLGEKPASKRAGPSFGVGTRDKIGTASAVQDTLDGVAPMKWPADFSSKHDPSW